MGQPANLYPFSNSFGFGTPTHHPNEKKGGWHFQPFSKIQGGSTRLVFGGLVAGWGGPTHFVAPSLEDATTLNIWRENFTAHNDLMS